MRTATREPSLSLSLGRVPRRGACPKASHPAHPLPPRERTFHSLPMPETHRRRHSPARRSMLEGTPPRGRRLYRDRVNGWRPHTTEARLLKAPICWFFSVREKLPSRLPDGMVQGGASWCI